MEVMSADNSSEPVPLRRALDELVAGDVIGNPEAIKAIEGAHSEQNQDQIKQQMYDATLPTDEEERAKELERLRNLLFSEQVRRQEKFNETRSNPLDGELPPS